METVRIERFTSRVHAELACSMLQSHGINARVSGDDVGGVHPDIPYGIGGTALEVPTEQLEEATALLDAPFDGPLGDDGDVLPAGAAVHGPDGADLVPPDARDATHTDDRAGDTDAGDTDWVATGRAAERRWGIKTFAVFAAIAMFVVFASVTGVAAGLWG